MGFTKKHIFDEQQNKIANYTKMIAHPARVSIIQYISKNEDCNCNSLVQAIGLAQPTISQHLSEIRKVGLLKQTVKGKNLFYSINQDKLNECRRVLNDFFVKTQVNCSKK
ncbi:ArsR family transcriptional regulator [Lacinutrix venerupis]|uniref:Transcriptional regulator n=1 Tax=Lacinutrix venerupis TaxID=1486034 RepID=A0AAC9LIU4_9FLAO|nr:metalloregulator ArsR/SmtB family transcription factor [Lacinutrix venerupis]APX99193.1 transcriptional regulator [Lacinutrix venerupis]RLJ65566.1 ArsR family transcriptional regulator [Lacinutrix venerupis]